MKISFAGIAAAVFTLGFSSVCLADDPGADLFGKKCGTCHGKDGKGQTTMGKKLAVADLTDAKVQDALAGEKLEKIISEGNTAKKMPAFKDKLSADELKAVVTFVRGLKGK
ncbi:MAG: c-type cytochrome [Myxococcaceae bacterium]